MGTIIDFEYSAWLIVVCVIAGLAYASVQYQRKSPWSDKVNRLLAVLRAVLVFLLSLLLLGPTISSLKNYFEKPIMVLAIDNSVSISMVTDSLKIRELKQQIISLQTTLVDKGWQVDAVDINGKPINVDSIEFNVSRTDLTKMVKGAQAKYDGSNLKGIVVISDGIFNSGFSPDFIGGFTPIYCLGVGDTIQKKDLSIIDVRHNRTVYQDNMYPVEVSIRNDGLGPGTVILGAYQNDKLIAKATLTVNANERLIQQQLLLKADSPGKQRIVIKLESLPGESTILNNNYSFFIDIIDGQQRILIAAEAPTPDIKALRLAIAKNDHFEVDVVINGPITRTDYDLIIYVQSPVIGRNSKVYDELKSLRTARLYVIGSRTDISRLNRDNIINFTQANGQKDQITPVLNEDFKGFALMEDASAWLADLPPITVPFGNVVLGPLDKVLLYQRIGNVATKRPVLILAESEPKTAIFIGEGFWKWRLDEYGKEELTAKFDELITKTLLYLTAEPDKRQFKIYPADESLEEGDEITFVSETYNELFEPVFGELVKLQISGSSFSRNYSFTPVEGSRNLRIDQLPGGIYAYTGTTTIDGKQLQASGKFVVEEPNLEAADLTADYTLLRKLAKDSGGKFYKAGDTEQLERDFVHLEAPAIIHSQERAHLLVNLPWILILLITMSTGEWLTRKMLGGY